MFKINLHRAIVGNLSHRELVERIGLTREEGIIVHKDEQYKYDDIKVSVLRAIINKILQAAEKEEITLREKEIFLYK